MVGDNLSAHKNIEFLYGNSPEELRDQLAAIQLPFKLITIYALGGRHYAWIVPTVKVTKVKKTKDQ